MFFEQLLNGLAIGSIYALLALGFTLVYGILFFINFPHGDILMVGAFLALVLLWRGVAFWPTLLISMVLTALAAAIVEKVAYSRLRYSRRLAPLLSALGVSLVLSNGAMLIFGPQTRPFPEALSIDWMGVFGIQPIIVFILALSILFMVLLRLFLKKTDTGIAILAASMDLRTAQLMGINPGYVISVTFAIGGGLAAAGGMLLAARYGSIYPSVGVPLMLKAFAACVLGGIGSVEGAVVGAFIVAIAEVMTVAYVSSSYRDAGAFVILVLVLLIRPSGIFGGREEVIV